jgi:hypothetical protein
VSVKSSNVAGSHERPSPRRSPANSLMTLCDSLAEAINRYNEHARRARREVPTLEFRKPFNVLCAEVFAGRRYDLALDALYQIYESIMRIGPRGNRDLDEAVAIIFTLRDYLERRAKPGQRPRQLTGVSRRARSATSVAVHLLPPADRERYREEFAAELADLPRCDQAPYAFRLVSRSWSLRRSLTGRSTARSTTILISLVVTTGAETVWLPRIGWPAAFLGAIVVLAAVWTVSSRDRARRLGNLIRAFRGSQPTNRKKLLPRLRAVGAS